MKPWLSVVGLGEDGLEGLTPGARALLGTADVLVGGKRHLAMVPDDGRERWAWPTPLESLFPDIEARRGQSVCILASGDPMLFGVGVKLTKYFPVEEMVILPGRSAFSLAAARLGWGLMDVECLTLHGRPVSLLEAYLQPNARLLILSEDGETPEKVAKVLGARGFGESAMTVFEHMDGPAERRLDGTAETWREETVADLNTVAVACVAGSEARVLSRIPGLPDEAYRTDGQLTKREVRAATLARLQPLSGQLLWDVGAGAGSISIEWMRAVPRTRAVAVERDKGRSAMIVENAQSLGVPLLDVVVGAAPDALEGLESPDAIFVGGGAAAAGGLLDTCWDALKPGGRLVANVVTIEGEAVLKTCHDSWGGEMARIAVSRLSEVGPYRGWRPQMPVTQFAAVKS
jgi:precorrin-6Y C5,15-methyltransferase (decarboxylating)